MVTKMELKVHNKLTDHKFKKGEKNDDYIIITINIVVFILMHFKKKVIEI